MSQFATDPDTFRANYRASTTPDRQREVAKVTLGRGDFGQQRQILKFLRDREAFDYVLQIVQRLDDPAENPSWRLDLADWAPAQFERVFALHRLGKDDLAEHICRSMIEDGLKLIANPEKAGAFTSTWQGKFYGRLGRIYKDRARRARRNGRMNRGHALAKRSAEHYLAGYMLDQAHGGKDFYNAINALTMAALSGDEQYYRSIRDQGVENAPGLAGQVLDNSNAALKAGANVWAHAAQLELWVHAPNLAGLEPIEALTAAFLSAGQTQPWEIDVLEGKLCELGQFAPIVPVSAQQLDSLIDSLDQATSSAQAAQDTHAAIDEPDQRHRRGNNTKDQGAIDRQRGGEQSAARPSGEPLVPNLNPRQRRILSLDGGGLRGQITLKVLMEMENILAQSYGMRPGPMGSFRLGQYFDAIVGTSTGGLIAMMLAFGYSVQEIQSWYRDSARAIFGQPITPRLMGFPLGFVPHIHPAKGLQSIIDSLVESHFGHVHATWGELIKVLNGNQIYQRPHINPPILMITAQKVKPSPIRQLMFTTDENSDLNQPKIGAPVWSSVQVRDIARATSAGPTYFTPAKVDVEFFGSYPRAPFYLVDGAITGHKNPILAGLAALYNDRNFNLNKDANSWFPKGETKLLVVSVGTGMQDSAPSGLAQERSNPLWNALSIGSDVTKIASNLTPLMINNSVRIAHEQCLLLGRDRSHPNLQNVLPTGQNQHDKDFTYIRYDMNLSETIVPKIGHLGRFAEPEREELAMDNPNSVENGLFETLGDWLVKDQVDIKTQFKGFMP